MPALIDGYTSNVKHAIKVGLCLLTFLAVSTSALASGTLAGIWHGRVRFDMANLPPLKNPRMNSARMANLTKLQQIQLSLTLKGDHTYTLRTIGGPQMTPQITGTWRVTGSALSLQQMDHGLERGYPKVYTVDKSGKNFSITQADSGITTTLSFFR